MSPYEHPDCNERLEADGSCDRPGTCQVSLQKATPLAQMPSPEPEQPQSTRQAQGQLHFLISPCCGCLEDGSQVVQFLLQPIEPQQLFGAKEVRLSCLHQRKVVACVRPAG